MRKVVLSILSLVLSLGYSYPQERSSDIIFESLDLIDTKTKDLLNTINLLEVNLMKSETALDKAESNYSQAEEISMTLMTQLNESERKQRFFRNTTIGLAAVVVIETTIIVLMKAR